MASAPGWTLWSAEDLLDRASSDGNKNGDNAASDEEVLQCFRAQLTVGMPVRLANLKSRTELNDKAGFLTGWDVGKQRWVLQVGSETLLVRAAKLAP